MVLKFNAKSRSLVTQDVVEIMFSGGLSVELIKCLKICVNTVPSLKHHIQLKLRSFIYNKLYENAHQRKMVCKMEIKRASHRNSSVFGLKSWFNSATSHSSQGVLNSRELNEMEVIMALQVLTEDDFFPKVYPDDSLYR